MRHLALALTLFALLAVPSVSAASNAAHAVNLQLSDFAAGFVLLSAHTTGMAPDSARTGVLAEDSQLYELVSHGVRFRINSDVYYYTSTTKAQLAWKNDEAKPIVGAQLIAPCSSGAQCVAFELNTVVTGNATTLDVFEFQRGRYRVIMIGISRKGIMTPHILTPASTIVDTRILHAQ